MGGDNTRRPTDADNDKQQRGSVRLRFLYRYSLLSFLQLLFFLLTSSHVVGVGVGVGVVAVPEPAAVLAVAHVLRVAAFSFAVGFALVKPLLASRDFAELVVVRHLVTAHSGAALGAVVGVASGDGAPEPVYIVVGKVIAINDRRVCRGTLAKATPSIHPHNDNN